VSPQVYGVLFGVNAFGLIACSQINRALLKRRSDRLLLKRALRVNLVAVVVLGIDGLFNIGGLAGLMIPLFAAMSSMGFISPNAVAAAMARSGGHAGSASALIGGVQFAAAAISGALVSTLQNGTALPMCGTILLLSTSAFVVHRMLAEEPRRPRSA
jgi:DHA1 family bicyclomycin/chloramphenicol resistance-like MFS transporter